MGIQVGYINILESGTVTVTSAVSGYPAYRLYDRYFGKFWQATGTAQQTIAVDQGASTILQIDTLVIPGGHNLSGATMYLEYSSDGTNYYSAPGVSSWTQADNNLIFKQMSSPQTYRYWRVRFTVASVAAQVAEVFLTLLKSFSPGAQASINGQSSYGYERNIVRNRPKSGLVQFIVCGSPVRFRDYYLDQCMASDLAILQALDAAWAGAMPFFFVDSVMGDSFFAELLADTTGSSSSTDGGTRFLVFTPKETVTQVELQLLEVMA